MNKQSNTNPKPIAQVNSNFVQQWFASDGAWFMGVFSCVSIVLCYSLWLHPTGHLHSIPVGDKGTNLWNLWWVYYALFERHVSPLWCDLIYYPWGGDLRFHTLSIVNGIIAAPITAVFGAVVSYNFLFFVWTVLTGVFGALWGKQFGLSKLCAFAVGFIAAFHPFRWNHIEHLNLFSTAWLLASFYYCEKWIEQRSVSLYNCFLLCWGLALFSNWYFGLFIGIYFTIRVLVELFHCKSFISYLSLFACCFIPAIWFGGLLFMYFQPPNANPPYPTVPDDVSLIFSSYWSLTLFHYFTPIWLLNWLPPPNNSGAEFRFHPGLVGMVIIVSGLWYWKSLRIAKHVKKFLLFLILVFFLISLGPFLQVLGLPLSINNIPVPMPAVAFEFIPGLTSMRVYARFAYIAWLGLTIIGLFWIQEKILAEKNKTTQWVIIASVMLVFLVETGWKPLKVQIYKYESNIQTNNIGGPMLEIPFEPSQVSGTHLYHQTLHHKPVYAVEFSRIPSYRKAYLDQHPFLKQINAYVLGIRLTKHEEDQFLDTFCKQIDQLGIQSLEIGKLPPPSILLDRKQKILERFNDCAQSP